MSTKKKVGMRDVAQLAQEILEAIANLEAAEMRLHELLDAWGIDIASPRYDPPQKRLRKTRASKKSAKKPAPRGGESLRTLKIKGRSIGAVINAGYPTFEKLNGASKAKLLKVKGVGEGLIMTLEQALKKRGMSLRD